MKRFMKPLYALPTLATLLALSLIAGVAAHISALYNGTEITVEARGYDPRALLLGHYVRLEPDVSVRLTNEQVDALRKGQGSARNIRNVWISLEPQGETWQISSVTAEKPGSTSTDQQVVILGDLSTVWSIAGDAAPRTYRPDFGMDRFYANQTEALRIEQHLRDGDDVRMILNVDEAGKASLKGISIDGERTLVSWW